MRDQYDAERRDRAEDLRLAREALTREQEMRRAEKSRAAAAALVEPLARLDEIAGWLSKYGNALVIEPAGAAGTESRVIKARIQECQEVLAVLQRSVRTTLLLVGDNELTSRYRQLVSLVAEAVAETAEPAVALRIASDITNYLHYVRLSLRKFIDGDQLPPNEEAPVLDRRGSAVWTPRSTSFEELDS